MPLNIFSPRAKGAQAIPKAGLGGELAVAQGFNTSIFWAVTLGIVISASLGFYSDSSYLVTIALLMAVMGALQFLLMRGWLKTTSAAMLSILFAGVFFSMYRFGSVSIAQASLAGVPLIYSVIVLGETTGALLLLLSIAVSGWITFLQVTDRLSHASPTIPEAQWTVLTVGLFVAFRMATLFKRNLLDANQRIQIAQNLLLQERTNSNANLQEALTELEQQKHVIDQHAIVINLQPSGTISKGNTRFVEVSGYTPAEFIGQPIASFYSGSQQDAFFSEVIDIVNREQVWHGELALRARDGHTFWLDTTIAAFMNAEGHVREYISVSSDISKRRLAEQAANAASRAKSDFLANMSHEIRTPMNGVVGTVDVLNATELNPEQRRMVETIHDSSLTLLQILNDVLDFSKIEAGKLELEVIDLDLVALVEGVVQLMLNIARERNITLTVWVDPTLPRVLRGDPTRLRQILFNLLGNALKFTSGRAGQAGKVEIRVQSKESPGSETGLEIQITDNGIGMKSDQVSRLFEAFTQGDNSTARKFGGTGLGLSITRRLVDMMKGQLLVQSSPGLGSTFTVILPLLAAPAGQTLTAKQGSTSVAEASNLQHPRKQRMRDELILIAEDNEINRDVLREQLQLLGLRSECAFDGVEALQMWRSGRYSLLLTDCHMPNMDGFSLAQSIRDEEPPYNHMPILAITANALQGEAQRCLNSGMDDYLTKPLRLGALEAKLAVWLPETASRTEPEVWDASALTRLVGENPEMQLRLRTRFLENASEQVRRLQQLMDADDTVAVAELAHELKSSARTVGALLLGSLCDQLEQCARQGDVATMQTLVAGVESAFAEVTPQIRV
jgi:PAS domain S-box-containing protein